MKIFITGGSGLIGQYLNLGLNGRNQILTQYCRNKGNCGDFNNIRLAITDFGRLEETFNDFGPDAVIHTAAVSNAEKADRIASDSVYQINVTASKKIAELCLKYNARLIYLSTDLVYAGYRGSMLKEDARLNPVSLYAETKLMGEVKIRETFDNYLILRTALQFGFGLNRTINNFHRSYESLKNNNPVKLFTDQFRSPLSLFESARIIGLLLEKDIRKEIVNFAGPERLNRYEMIEILCEEAGFDKKLLIGTSMEEAGLNYKVEDVSLDIGKLLSFGVRVKSYRDSVKEILSQMNQK
jgi:dTDP-4-dehydrorhamnose reductase